MDSYLENYSQWAKVRVISKIETPDSEPRCIVYRYKVQRQKRFLWFKWWHTELSCTNRKIAKEVYNELISQARERRKK